MTLGNYTYSILSCICMDVIFHTVTYLTAVEPAGRHPNWGWSNRGVWHKGEYGKGRNPQTIVL